MNENEYYYYPTENDEEDIEVSQLMQDVFWSLTRAHVYNKVHKGKGGVTQWSYITGKVSRLKTGERVQLTRKNEKLLWNIVEYLGSEEGRAELIQVGINEPPEHIDDLIDILASAKTREQTKKEEFQLFLKYRERILNFLSKL